jgi:hypothetical protein
MFSRVAVCVVVVCVLTSQAFADPLRVGPVSGAKDDGQSRRHYVHALPVQSPSSDKATVGLVKMVIGLGLVAGGALVAATSNYSSDVCITEPFAGRICSNISARNNGQLISGLGAAGAGAVLIWWGAKDRKAANNPSLVTVAVSNGVRIRYERTW